MKKTFKVVMLPTEKAKNSILLNNSNKLTYFKNYLTQDYLKNVLNSNSNHLYITSDEEIKEGDWLFFWNNKELDSYKPEQYQPNKGHVLNNGVRKIVATTDKSLNVIQEDKDPRDWGYPQLPESFIQAYIKAYNEGKPITEVDLEMDNTWGTVTKDDWRIKTRPDNTVIVHQSKMYSRDEVIRLLDKAVDETDEIGQWRDRDKWIQDNL